MSDPQRTDVSSSIVTSAPSSVPTNALATNSARTLQENAQIFTNTTTVDTTVGSVLTATSVIPYMRPLAIDFIGYRLRPDRELWFYFDDIGINKFIQRPNIVEVFTGNTVNDMRSGPQRVLQIGSASARILHSEKSISTGNTVYYVSEFKSPSTFSQNATVTISSVGYSTTLNKYQHSSGFVQANTSNIEVILSADANGTVDNYYNGNTITILNGTNAGQSAEIISYNCITRTALVLPSLKINPKETDLIYTLGDYRTWYVSNTYPSSYTTSRGIVSGVFHVPDPNKNPQSRFRTGEKIFRILDNPFFGINHPEFGVGNITTRADYRFISNGLDQSRAQIIERDIDFNVPAPSPTPTPSGTPRVTPTSTATPPVTGTPAKTPTPTSTPNPTVTPSLSLSGSPVPITPTPTKTPPRTSPPVTVTPSATRTPPATSPRPTQTPSISRPRNNNEGGGGNGSNGRGGPISSGGGGNNGGRNNQGPDPIAQSFFISAANYPDGVFVSSVDLFFKNKGSSLPVEVQIRPVENGYPSSNTIIPGATTTVDIEDIKISNFPNTSNSMTATRFTFPSPVYLSPSFEYAILAVTDDFGYDYYSAELGGTVIGTDRRISQQAFTGSFFKSQNSRTWTALQNEDLMFVLNKAQFSSASGTAIFDEDKTTLLKEISSNVSYDAFSGTKSNTAFDSFELRSDAIELNNTKLNYYFKGVSNSTKTLASSYLNFNPDKKFDLEERNVLFNPQLQNKSMTVRIDLSTKNPDVSPVVYHNRQNMVTIENIINDTGLTADRFTITNAGINYDTSNAYITISSNVGYGANAWAVADGETGNIVSIVVDSPGVGYVDDVTATIGGGAGTDATVSVSTETGTSGGPALARYISKTVSLVDGFDAGDLRVFLTAVKPPGSNVNVYYKVRNSLDPQKIEDRNWVRMTQKTSQYSFSVNRNPVEYEYRPSLTSNNVTYSTDTTTYKTFNQFAIKIVLSSRSTVANAVPYVLDVRAIALPEDVY